MGRPMGEGQFVTLSGAVCYPFCISAYQRCISYVSGVYQCFRTFAFCLCKILFMCSVACPMTWLLGMLGSGRGASGERWWSDASLMRLPGCPAPMSAAGTNSALPTAVCDVRGAGHRRPGAQATLRIV